MKRVTPTQSLQRKQASAKGPMARDAGQGVARTGRLKPAYRAEDRSDEPGQGERVEADQCDEHVSEHGGEGACSEDGQACVQCSRGATAEVTNLGGAARAGRRGGRSRGSRG